MRFFITKWVIARGILVVESPERPKVINQSIYQYAHLPIPGWRNGYPLKVGQEVFLTLREAKEDAHRRFDRHLRRLRVELRRTQKVVAEIKSGKGPKVHTKIRWLNQCKAF